MDDTVWGLSLELIGVVAQLDKILDDGKRDEDGAYAVTEEELLEFRDAVYGGLIRSLGPDAPDLLQAEFARRAKEEGGVEN